VSFRLKTERLVLREWHEVDAVPFHAMCNDPRVMEFLGPAMSREDIDAALERQRGFQRDHGYCFWALERRLDGAFLGFCGIKPGKEKTPLHGRPEIGWRLAHHAWGQGLAREAAKATLDWGFGPAGLGEIFAMTVPGNVRSWGLMERLGMVRHPQMDFDHADFAQGHPLRPHIVYRALAQQP